MAELDSLIVDVLLSQANTLLALVSSKACRLSLLPLAGLTAYDCSSPELLSVACGRLATTATSPLLFLARRYIDLEPSVASECRGEKSASGMSIHNSKRSRYV